MIEQITHLGPIIMACILALNLFLAGLQKALELLKDIIPGEADNKLIAIIAKVLVILQKIIDYAGMNREHK